MLGQECSAPEAALVDRTGFSGHLAVLHGNEVVYVLEERAVGRTRLVTDVGVRLPAALTASGRAMLAALTARQVAALFPGSRCVRPAHRPGPDVTAGTGGTSGSGAYSPVRHRER